MSNGGFSGSTTCCLTWHCCKVRTRAGIWGTDFWFDSTKNPVDCWALSSELQDCLGYFWTKKVSFVLHLMGKFRFFNGMSRWVPGTKTLYRWSAQSMPFMEESRTNSQLLFSDAEEFGGGFSMHSGVGSMHTLLISFGSLRIGHTVDDSWHSWMADVTLEW